MKQLTLQEQYNLICEGKGNKSHFHKQVLKQFPHLFTAQSSFDQVVTVLKQKQIISENITLNNPDSEPNWFDVFSKNIAILNEEVKATEKKTTKEVEDIQSHNYNYKDEKSIDNHSGAEFLLGFYVESRNIKNIDKTVEQIRGIVIKNLAKDPLHYVKSGQFGVEGLGYTEEAPGLGKPKEAKGKYKSSGYGNLNENKLRSIIRNVIKENINEISSEISFDYDFEEFEFNGDFYNIKATINATVIKGPEVDVSWYVESIDDVEKYNEDIQNYESIVLSPDEEAELKVQLDDIGGYIDDDISDIAMQKGYESDDTDFDEIDEAKPSAGLTKKEKSDISKKIRAGKDIGKKGKGFEKVAKAAGGGEKGKRIAAAAMWKKLAKNKQQNENFVKETSEPVKKKVLPNKQKGVADAIKATSSLDKIIQQVYKESDLEKAKKIILDFVENSRMNKDSKAILIKNVNQTKSKRELDLYITNALLKFEKLGVRETEYDDLIKRIKDSMKRQVNPKGEPGKPFSDPKKLPPNVKIDKKDK